jgi:hypothetical protein
MFQSIHGPKVSWNTNKHSPGDQNKCTNEYELPLSIETSTKVATTKVSFSHPKSALQPFQKGKSDIGGSKSQRLWQRWSAFNPSRNHLDLRTLIKANGFVAQKSEHHGL